MTETVTNKAANTASATNKEFSSKSKTWDKATFTWGEATETWDNPEGISNNAASSESTVTNKTLT